MSLLPFIPSVQSYSCDEYTYHYHNRGCGENACLVFQMKQEVYAEFVKLHWPRNERPGFQNLLITHRAGGWHRVDCMSDQAELRLKRFLRFMNLYFAGKRERQRQAERAAQQGVSEGPLIRRYRITVSPSFRRTAIVPREVAKLRAEAKGVIEPSDDPRKPPVAEGKLKALVAKFQSQVQRGNYTVH